MSNNSETVAPNKTYAWYVLVMLLMLYMFNYVDRYIASSLLERIKETFEVSDGYMGFLVGPAFAMSYTLLAIPIALLADRYNRVRIIAIGAIIWSVFTVLSGLTNTPATFALARVGVGVGEAAFIAPAYSLLSDYFPPKRRALSFAILNFGVYFGTLIGQIGGPIIAEASHWRTAFKVLGAPGILLALIAWFTIKEPKRGRLDGDQVGKVLAALPFVESVKTLIARRSYRLLVIGTAFGGFASYGFGFWAQTLFIRVFELSDKDAGIRYGLSSVGAGLLGAILIGILCDRLASRDIRWPPRLAAIGIIGFITFSILMCFAPSANIATLLTIPAGLMGGGWVVAVLATLQDLLPSRMRAIGTAIWSFALTFSGLALGLWFAGLVANMFDQQFGTESLRYALTVILICGIPASAFLVLAGNAIKGERDAGEKASSIT